VWKEGRTYVACTPGNILTEAGFERRGNTYRFRRVLARQKLRLPLPRAS
jgi:hypothetical protein